MNSYQGSRFNYEDGSAVRNNPDPLGFDDIERLFAEKHRREELERQRQAQQRQRQLQHQRGEKVIDIRPRIQERNPSARRYYENEEKKQRAKYLAEKKRHAEQKRREKLRREILALVCVAMLAIPATITINAIKNDKSPDLDKNTATKISTEYNFQDNTTVSVYQVEDISYQTSNLVESEKEHRCLGAKEFCNSIDDFIESDQKIEGNTNEEKVWNFLHDGLGCSEEQSAAILGNIVVESNCNPCQHQIGGNAIGLFMFDGARKDRFMQFAKDNYPDTYQKLNSPGTYSAASYSELYNNPPAYNSDEAIKCNFAYLAYEMRYGEDANYEWNQFDSCFDENYSASEMSKNVALNIERTTNQTQQRMDMSEQLLRTYQD